MAYIKPLVQVFQEYENLSTPSQTTTLNVCVIGPCYHKVDISSNNEADLYPALAGFIENGSMATAEIPNLLPGAQIDEESITFLFRGVYAAMSDTSISVDSTSQATVTFLSSDFPTGIKEGDYITLTDSDTSDVIADKVQVISFDDTAFTVTLAKMISTSAVNITADWLRKVDSFTIPYDDSVATVDAVSEEVGITGLTVMVDGVEKDVYFASVFVGHKAIRQDVTEIGSAESVTEIETKLGTISSENPLAMGASIALANTSMSVYFIGVPSDDTAGYTTAKDILEGVDNMYALVPLTQKSGILNIFGTHASQMSLPEKGSWRIAIGNTPLPSTVTVASGNATVEEDLSSDPRVLNCPTGDFLTNEVKSGDTVLVYTDPETSSEFSVDTVISEDALIVTEDLATFSVGSSYDIEVTRTADKALQAQAVGDTSRSFNNSRFVHVWPDRCYIDEENLPGYYLCCAVGGMVSGLPSHQGMTRLSIAGINRLENSNDYFNAEQMDFIADGGTFIFMQLNPSSPPYVRHQMTTDTSTLEFQELSFVKNYDFVSYIMKDVLDAFIGQYNITPTTLAGLETAVRATLESLKLYSVPKIGSPVLAYGEISVGQLEGQKDRVEIYALVEFPYPLNMVGLHLVSTSV